MLQHLFFVAIFLAFSSSLTAFQGFYVGGAAGGAATVGRQKGTTIATNTSGGVSSNAILDIDTDLFDGSWQSEFFAGYGSTWCHSFYWGLEAFFLYSKNEFKETKENLFPTIGASISESSEIDIGPWHVGADARFGFLINPSTLLYARGGVEWSPFDLKASAVFINSPGFVPLTTSKRKEKIAAHPRLGLGIETQFCRNLSFRADYIYTYYGRVHLFDSVARGTFVFNTDAKVHLHNHALLLGLSYYFSKCPAFYNDGCCCGCEFCGLYLAGVLGGSLFEGRLRGDNSGTFTVGGTPLTFIVDVPNTIADINVMGTAYFGVAYQWGLWNHLFSALELFWQLNHAFRKRTDESLLTSSAGAVDRVTFETRAEIKPFQGGVAFRPGIIITPSSLMYGSIGTSFATIELRSDSEGRFILGATDLTGTLSVSKRSTRATLRVGGGFEYMFCPSWHLRAEYIYTNYGSIQVRRTSTTPVGGDTVSLFADTKVHFKTHDVTLGIAKYF